MHVTDFLKHLKQKLQETVDNFPKASVLSYPHTRLAMIASTETTRIAIIC